MKSILLATTAIVAFAGAAAADGHTGVAFSGSAALGYNDDIEDGFFWSADVGVLATAALDNGVTATAAFTLLIAEDDLAEGDIEGDGDYVLTLATETASLTFGDVDPVAEANWGGVDGASVADFNDQDVHFLTADFDAMLVGEVTYSGVTAMLSYGVALNGTNAFTNEDLDALQVYASGEFAAIGFEFAYQDEFGPTPQIIGVAGTYGIAGAELTASYLGSTDIDSTLADEEETSFGLGVSYPVGPVTLGGYYSLNDVAEDGYGVSADYVDGPIAVSAFYDFEGGATDADADDFSEFGVEGSYDTGLNLSLLAGYIATDASTVETAAYYVAGVYDLGGGAELLVSYAEDEADDPFDTNDEIGDPEYLSGTTVEVTFSF